MDTRPKLLLVSIPRLSPSPQLGLQFLVKQLKSADIHATIYDANLILYQMYANDSTLWSQIELWGIQQQSQQQTDPELWLVLKSIFIKWANDINQQNPTYVGISVFTHESRNWASWLCYFIRSVNPDIKIWLGGKGICVPGVPYADFAQICLDWELCDFYFNGEAENEMINFFQDKPHVVNNYQEPLINHNIDVHNFEILDTSHYNMTSNWYAEHDFSQNHHVVEKQNSGGFKIFSTRGCVKKCSFCDVHLVRPQFSMRTPDNLFNEIQYALDRGHREFHFADDMINGSNSQFMRWLAMTANYLEQNNITDFSWYSQLGIKSHRSTPTEMFDLLEKTSANLRIGIDHFSNSVLEHMQKRHTCDDIFWFFEQGKNKKYFYDVLLFVCSYPTEMQQDFDQFCQGIKDLVPFKDQINILDFGTTCSIPTGSKLQDLPGMHLGATQVQWYYDDNPSLDGNEKLRRRRVVGRLADDLKFKLRINRTQWARMEKWLAPTR